MSVLAVSGRPVLCQKFSCIAVSLRALSNLHQNSLAGGEFMLPIYNISIGLDKWMLYNAGSKHRIFIYSIWQCFIAVQWSSGYDFCLTSRVLVTTEGLQFDPGLNHFFLPISYLSELRTQGITKISSIVATWSI